jgi:hypothetical protein
MPLPGIERARTAHSLVTIPTELSHVYLLYPTRDSDTLRIRFPTTSFLYRITKRLRILHTKKSNSFVIFQHRNVHIPVIKLESRCIEFHQKASTYWLREGRVLQCSVLWRQLPNGFYI